MTKEPQLSRRERQILDILYGRGQATAEEVQRGLPDAPSYSAVRALLRILEEKGHAKHHRQGLRYVYLPQESRAQASRSALKRILATFFNGSVDQAIAALLEASDSRLSDADIAKLQSIIGKARKEGR
ncbi:MAG: CopY family transcriptional regulator [Verrucomicrobia bacterium]|nr:MAG: CopY family transcriptional regulator [Verrucomicrobiota bacterium]